MTEHMADVVDIDLAKMTPADKRDAARRLAAADPALTGGEIGRRFGEDARWGRRQAEAGRREAPASDRPGHVEVTAPAPPAPDEAPPGTPDTPPTDRPAVDGDPWPARWALAAGRLGVLAVAAALSYSHMRQLVLDAGGQEWEATLWPLSVDGLLVVALVTLQRARRGGGSPVAPWVALVASLAASLAANVAAAEPTPIGWFIGAWPPLALLAIEVLGRPRGRQ